MARSPKSRRPIKILPEDPTTERELEEETKNYWGYTMNRHGIWGDTVKEVNWDAVSEPINALQANIENGFLTSTALPLIIHDKYWRGLSGGATVPTLSFQDDIESGIYLISEGVLGFSTGGVLRMSLDDDGLISNYSLAFKDGTNFLGEFNHSNSANRIYTLQDAAGTLYQTGGTDISIADGGTGQSSKTPAFDALSPTTTKGDVIVYNGSDNVRVAVGSNNQSLLAASGEATGVKWVSPVSLTVYKEDNEDVTSGTTGTTLQDDGHLVFSIAANETWTGTMVLFVVDQNSGGSADFKIKITVPSGATVRYGSSGGEGAAGEDSQDYVDNTSDIIVFTHSNTDEYIHEVKFSVQNSTNAGTVQLQWAQNAAQAGIVRVIKGSYLEATRVV